MSAHVRQHDSMLAAAEKQALIWIASRLPPWINPDHLSALGLISMAGAGLSFWLMQTAPMAGAALVTLSLLLNWFGDSLDGTLARVRNAQRPRYGYYVDHVLDLAGTAMLFAGVAASGLMSPLVAAIVVAGYYLVAAEAFLATHSRAVFKMAFAGVGPTELRILLMVGAFAVVNSAFVSPFGFGPIRLWDLGGLIGTAGMIGAFLVSAARNGLALYVEETRRPSLESTS